MLKRLVEKAIRLKEDVIGVFMIFAYLIRDEVLTEELDWPPRVLKKAQYLFGNGALEELLKEFTQDIKEFNFEVHYQPNEGFWLENEDLRIEIINHGFYGLEFWIYRRDISFLIRPEYWNKMYPTGILRYTKSLDLEVVLTVQFNFLKGFIKQNYSRFFREDDLVKYKGFDQGERWSIYM